MLIQFLDPKITEIIRKIEAYEKRLFAHTLHGGQDTENLLTQVEKKQKVLGGIKDKKKELKKAKQVIPLDELKARKRVLRRLGYATDADVIETKGRVACEVSTADEVKLIDEPFSTFLAAFNGNDLQRNFQHNDSRAMYFRTVLSDLPRKR
jgi:ATP-dependent RNA helicase DOB1